MASHAEERNMADQLLDTLLEAGDQCMARLVKTTRQTKKTDSGPLKCPDRLKKTQMVVQQHLDDEDIAELVNKSEVKVTRKGQY